MQACQTGPENATPRSIWQDHMFFFPASGRLADQALHGLRSSHFQSIPRTRPSKPKQVVFPALTVSFAACPRAWVVGFIFSHAKAWTANTLARLVCHAWSAVFLTCYPAPHAVTSKNQRITSLLLSPFAATPMHILWTFPQHQLLQTAWSHRER